MSNGKLLTRQIFGVSTANKNCLLFKDNYHLLYISGNNVVVLNVDSKEQQFISGTTHPFRSLGFTCLAANHYKQTIAVAEKAVDNGVVTLYDSVSLRKKKTINYVDLGSKTIVSVSFSDDGKFFVCQGGAPEWNLCLWNIEKLPKLLTVYKSCPHEGDSISSISFCPYDPTVIFICGQNVAKLIKYQEGILKPLSMSLRRDQFNFTSHTWMPEERCLVGTEEGDILLIENFEFKTVVYPCGNENEDRSPLFSLVPTSRGFAAGTYNGEIRVFEKADDNKELYTLEAAFVLPRETSNVKSMALGLDDSLVCLTDSQQLYNCPLYSSNMLAKENTPAAFQPLFSPFHYVNSKGHADIIALDVALWRPLLASVAMDFTVRVWNIPEKRVEVFKQFTEEPIDIAIHPSGLYLIVAFIDKLLIMSILLEQLVQSREVSIRQCAVIKMSKGGALIAVSSASSINIHDFFTGDILLTLRGHASKIKSLQWMNIDSKLCSIGSDGTIFYWDVFPNEQKRSESISTSLHFSAGVSFSDRSKAYAALPEKTIREMVVISHVDQTPSKNIREIDLGSFVSVMMINESKQLLFAATADDDYPSCICAFMTFPQLSGTCEKAIIHGGNITSMISSYDGNYIFSGDSDGVIIMSEIAGAGETNVSTLAKLQGGSTTATSFDFQDEILLKKQNYIDTKIEIVMLQHKIEDMILNNEHALRLKEMNHKAKIKQITDDNNNLVEAEKLRLTLLQEQKLENENTFDLYITTIDTNQSHVVDKADAKYKAKINAELVRQRQIIDEIASIQQQWNEENEALVESHQQYVRELGYEFDEKLRLGQQLQKHIQQDKAKLEVEYSLLNQSIDSDCDVEMENLKAKYIQRLKLEEDNVMALMTEHALLKKSLQTLGKDAAKQKEEIKKQMGHQLRLEESILSIEKDVANHKKEIKEREETITDKDKRIFELKKKNQELEKFRFVLDYKIKELKMQIAPREEEIRTLRKQIEDMDLELDQYHKSNATLNLMINELKLKYDGMRGEQILQNERWSYSNRIIGKYRTDLQKLASVIEHYSLLKSGLINLYKLYILDDYGDESSTSGTPKKDEDPQLLYNRDREQLERSLEALRRASLQDAKTHKRDSAKMLRENVVLTAQLNDLRKQHMSYLLKKKAIDESGITSSGSEFSDIFDILGVASPFDKLLKSPNRTPTKSQMLSTQQSNAGGIFATEGVEEMKDSVHSSPMKSSAFTSPMKTPSIGPSPRSTSLSVYTGSLSPVPRGDQFEAWREIQIQNDQLQSLEDRLRELCSANNVDAKDVFQKVDESMALFSPFGSPAPKGSPAYAWHQ